MSLCKYMHMSSGLTEFGGIGSLELDLTGDSEPPNMGAGS